MITKEKYAPLLINEENKVLVVSKANGTKWIALGGKPEMIPEEGRMETAIECMIRETREEVGIELSDLPGDLEYLVTTDPEAAQDNPDLKIIIHFYWQRVPNGIEIHLNPADQITGVEWISVQDFMDQNLNIEVASGLAKYGLPTLADRLGIKQSRELDIR